MEKYISKIEKEFDEYFLEQMGKDDGYTEERRIVKSFLKRSFIKYLQSQQEIVKNIAFGVSPDQRGRKWIELEDLTKLYQAQIKELEG